MRTTPETMTENISQNSPITLKHFYTVFGTVLVLLLICGLFTYYILTRPIPPIPAGEIIDQFGTYISPNRTCTLEIGTNASGKLVVAYNLNHTETGNSWVRPKHATWFATIDDNDCLWFYIKGRAPDRDELIGVTINHSLNRTTHVGSGGGWEGIPDSFFERLPKSQIEKYETWKNNQE